MADAFEPRFADLVRIFTTTRGTDDFIVGSAVTGFRSFHSALEIGDRFYYCAVHSDRPSEREVGRGTLRADGKIAREPIGGVPTSFSPGSKTIALVAAAEWYDGIKQQIVAAEGVANDAAAAAAASAAQVANALTFTADSADAVGRSFADKIGDVVSVKDFGAIGDGIADDTAAMTAAFQHGCAHGVPIFVPPGTYIVDPFDGTDHAMRMTAVGAGRFVMFGAGASSIIKAKDGSVAADFMYLFQLAPTTDMEVIEFRDLFIDMNARGSTAPASSFDYQHSHAFAVEVPAGVTVKQVRFQNVVIKDPVADGFNNSGVGTVVNYVVANCAVIDRTRARSDVQFSTLPLTAEISGFNGTVIETEPNAASTGLRRISLSNCNVERLDIAAHSGDQATGYAEFSLSNVTTTVSTTFEYPLIRASNCRLVLPSDGRWNNLAAGSRFSNCRILHPYDGVANSIVSLMPLWTGGARCAVGFSNCDFEIDSADPAIAPTGYMIETVATVTAPDIGNNRLTVDNCRFDPRCFGSVLANRGGTIVLRDNAYGGVSFAIHYQVGLLKAVDLSVDGGDFSRVTGAAIGWAASAAMDQSTSIGFLRLSGEWTGVRVPVGKASGTLSSAYDNQILSTRRMSMTVLPAGGVNGDVVELQQAADGKPDAYRCVGSSVSAASWRMARQAGIKSGATANRPALTVSDAGTRYFDTSLAPAGKPIVWTGSAWVDGAGTAA